MNSLLLSTITVTHNHANYIGQCLNALVPEVERLGGEVIVVDNRSGDESAAILALTTRFLTPPVKSSSQPLSMIKTSDRPFTPHV